MADPAPSARYDGAELAAGTIRNGPAMTGATHAVPVEEAVDREGTMPDGLHDRDFHAWAAEQAALLRAGRLSEADVQNIAEEIETLGRGERRELVNRLAVLLLHLLKWSHQPERRGKSWRLTVEAQRRQLARHLRDNPSLRAWQDEALADAYGDAVLRAEQETSLPRDMFPWACPYSFEQVLDDAFWPEPA